MQEKINLYLLNIHLAWTMKKIIEHEFADGVQVAVFAAEASDIVQLQAIQDQSLFDRNVRYGPGKTRINREIARTVRTAEDHPSFLLFNNDVTIICENFTPSKGKLEIGKDTFSVLPNWIMNPTAANKPALT